MVDPGPRKARLRPLLALCRVSNLPTVWMNVVAAAALSGADFDLGPWLALIVSLSAFYCTGMALNDLFDRDWDAEHQPFRPIPSGALAIVTARRVAAALIALAFGALLSVPHVSALVPGAVLLGLIVAYDRIHKAYPNSVLLMAATRSMVFVVTAWALTARLPGLVLLGAALQFAYTLVVTAVARHEHTRGTPYGFPLIPRMIAGMSILDGTLLALFIHPTWLLAGIGAAVLTLLGQRYVRGD